MNSYTYAALAIATIIFAGCSSPNGGNSDGNLGADGAPAGASLTFAADIAPIFEARCAKCHIEGEKGELSLASLESALAGGKKGDDIVPGDSGNSLLVKMISGQTEKRMPPKGDPLSDAEIATIQQWIDGGAN